MSVHPHSTARRSYRMALAVALLFGLSSVFALSAPAATFAWSNDSFDSSSEADLVALTNRSRASAGLKALKVDSTLKSVARWRSKDMIDRDYFSHTIPGYGKVWDKLQRHRLLLQRRRREHRLEQLPGRHRDGRHPLHVHELAGSPREHHGQGLGRDRDRRLQGPDRQEDVDRPVRRQVRIDLAAGPRRRPRSRSPSPPPSPPRSRRRNQPPTRRRPRASPRRPNRHPSKARTRPRRRPRTCSPNRASTPSNPPHPSTEPATETPSDAPGDGAVGDGAVALRVVDRTTSDGLLETIVGGVTGFFFGG